MTGRALRHPISLGVAAALITVNGALGLLLAEARAGAIALALVPVLAVALGALIASNRAILVYAALAMNLFAPVPLTESLPLNTGIDVYPADVLVALAVGSWVAAWLMSPERARPASMGTHVLGWPLLLFGVVLVAVLLRSHEQYGTSLVSVPLRFLVYAGIAAALTDLKPRDAYRWLVILFYAGTVWQVLVALYGLASGTSATSSVILSTGGERVLAGSTAMLMAGALMLALMNLELDRKAGMSALHLVMAGLATFALIVTFQRTTFALVALLVPLFLLAFRAVGARAAVLLPLCAPAFVLAALLIPRADPSLLPTLADRLTANPSTDSSALWRERAIGAVWMQVREAPVTGVGFGREASFVVDGSRTTVAQDPHNQFLYLWAGGGLLLVGSFVLLLIVYLFECWRRFRGGSKLERRLIFWAVSLWFIFVVNSLTGIVLTVPHLLLSFWLLMLLPMVVRPKGMNVATPT